MLPSLRTLWLTNLESAGGFLGLKELTQLRATLERRYDELKYGRVEAIDGEAFFESLRQREDALLKRRT